jgi:chromosome segregation ATPase
MKNSIIEAMNRASDFKSSAARFDAMKHSIDERLLAIDAEAQRRADETARLNEELTLAKQQHAEEAERLEQAKRDLDGSVENAERRWMRSPRCARRSRATSRGFPRSSRACACWTRCSAPARAITRASRTF